MLFYCAYTWSQGTSAEQVRQRLLELDAAGLNQQESVRGWYGLAGGGSGFLLVEASDPRELTPRLQPWMDLVSWDVRAIYENDYDAVKQALQQAEQQAS